jgi:hypothetical protein
MPVREKGQGAPVRRGRVPSHVPSHTQTAAKLRGFSPPAPEFTAETDSPLEGEVPSRFVLEFDWRGLRLDEDTWSGSKVNRLIGEFLGQVLPSVDFAHGDLT